MSIYHLYMDNISRGKGQSAMAHYAYISGQEVVDERTGKTIKYKREDKILASGCLLPEGIPEKIADELYYDGWIQSLDEYEQSKTARIAKRIKIALQRELSLEKNRQLLEDWIYHNLTCRGYPATYAIHSSKDGNNLHAHIIAANRPLGPNGWTAHKNKKIYKLDSNGQRVPIIDPKTGQQKTDSRHRLQWQRISVETNPLDKKETLQQMRASWAQICNRVLDPDHAIDHRSYADRGISRAPTIHEGREAREIEARGGVSWRCEHNRQVKRLNIQMELQQYQIWLLEQERQEAARQAEQERDYYVCASYRDAERVAGGTDALIRAITGSPAWGRALQGRSDADQAAAQKQLRQMIKSGAKATVVVSLAGGGQMAASVITASSRIIKHTIGAIPVVGAPIRLAATAAEGSATRLQSGMMQLADNRTKQQRQRSQQEPPPRDTPPEPEHEDKGGNGGAIMPKVDDLADKYADYKWLNIFDKEELRLKELVRSI